MGIKILEALLKEKVEIFVQSFKTTSKSVFYDDKKACLIHPGEYGMYRESICKELIRYFIPARLQIGQGFIINTNDDVSTQCDLVLYDKFQTPLIENEEKQRFYTVETVSAVGEVKSVLSKSGLKDAINKLAKVKKLRELIKNPVFIKRDKSAKICSYNPVLEKYDNLFTFLICEKFDFKIDSLVDEINELYDKDIKFHQRHNLILSIDDGILFYYDKNDVSMMYPKIDGSNLKNRFTKQIDNPYIHFKLFLSCLFLGTSSSTILYPEISDYIGTIEGGVNFNEK